ncbi:MAG: PAS domain-containing protein [Actinobacteria bacterium]|nr:PAS domain-containing protein [Actinomycetota bacterium]
MTTTLGTERIRAARLIGSLDTRMVARSWMAALSESGTLRDGAPSGATVERIVSGLQRGFVMHLEAPRARLDIATAALADDTAMAQLHERGVSIAQITEGVFCFLDIIFAQLDREGLGVPAVAEMVRDFARRFLRMACVSWSAMLVGQWGDAERARAELQRILESTDEGILLVGRDLALRFANARLSELLGASLHVHIGENVHHLLTELVAHRVAEPEAFLARTRHLYGTMEQVSTDVVAVTEPPRTLSRYSAPVRDAAGQTIGRVEVYRDVTAERHARR